MNFFKRLFHRHKFERIDSTFRCIGYLRGHGIYMADFECHCGKKISKEL